jgi:hypothetical protein
MGTIFEHNYQVGESLRYGQTTNLTCESTQFGVSVGRATYEHVEDTLDVNDSGVYSIEIRRSLRSSEGPLSAEIPPELTNQLKVLRVDRSGRSHDQEEQLPTRLTFPFEPIDVGTTWSAPLPGPAGTQQPVELHSTVERIERQNGHTIGHIVSHGKAQGSDENGAFSVDLKATSSFSINQGCLLSSQTVLTTTWQNGTKTQAVVDLNLLERATRQLTSYEA